MISIRVNASLIISGNDFGRAQQGGFYKLSKDPGQTRVSKSIGIPYVATESIMQFTYIPTGSLPDALTLASVYGVGEHRYSFAACNLPSVCNYYLYYATIQMGNESLSVCNFVTSSTRYKI